MGKAYINIPKNSPFAYFFQIGKTYESTASSNLEGYFEFLCSLDIINILNISLEYNDYHIYEVEAHDCEKYEGNENFVASNKIKILREILFKDWPELLGERMKLESGVFQINNKNIEYHFNIEGLFIGQFTDGRETSYRKYDDKGKILEIYSFNSGKCFFEYDELGNIIKMFRVEKGNITEKAYYIYDDKKRLIEINYDGEPVIKNKYNELGNLVEQDLYGSHFYKNYNDLGQIVSIEDENGDIENFEYDKEGRLVYQDSHNSFCRITFDENGNIKSRIQERKMDIMAMEETIGKDKIRIETKIID
jgi:YD repeat-containing protein